MIDFKRCVYNTYSEECDPSYFVHQCEHRAPLKSAQFWNVRASMRYAKPSTRLYPCDEY